VGRENIGGCESFTAARTAQILTRGLTGLQRVINWPQISAAYPVRRQEGETTMRSKRVAEMMALGYNIERVDEYDDIGLLRSMRYEVLCPVTGAVLASQVTRRAAERFVIKRELRGAATLKSDRHLAA
jgi:hypothetical protein